VDEPVGQDARFPEEMCIFATLYVGDRDLGCLDGKWIER
jgi:hypothetical protein